MTIAETLQERGKNYGEFPTHAKLTQHMKQWMREQPSWENLTFGQKESLEMIAHKIGRILNGNPNYADSWRDIAGYAMLIVNDLLPQKTGLFTNRNTVYEKTSDNHE